MREPDPTPMIWTSKGNIPIEMMNYRTEWTFSPQEISLAEIYELRGEVVRRSVHVYKPTGASIGAQQQSF